MLTELEMESSKKEIPREYVGSSEVLLADVTPELVSFALMIALVLYQLWILGQRISDNASAWRVLEKSFMGGFLANEAS